MENTENLDLIKFDELFDLAISYWPEAISIKARRSCTDRWNTITETSGIYGEAEGKALETKNPLMEDMCYAIYGALHDVAEYVDVLRPHDINRDAVRERFEDGLFGDSDRQAEAKLYKAHNEPFPFVNKRK